MYKIFENYKAKIANSLRPDYWVLDNLNNLTEASNYRINLRYDTIEKSKLISGIWNQILNSSFYYQNSSNLGGLLNKIKTDMYTKLNGSPNEINIYSCVSFKYKWNHFQLKQKLIW